MSFRVRRVAAEWFDWSVFGTFRVSLWGGGCDAEGSPMPPREA